MMQEFVINIDSDEQLVEETIFRALKIGMKNMRMGFETIEISKKNSEQ